LALCDGIVATGSLSTVVEAIARASRRVGRRADPLERALGYGELIAELQDQVSLVAAERDAAITEVLATVPGMSHRRLAARLGVSAQRVDQLAKIARAGGRPRA
jgi:hypothetical protein